MAERFGRYDILARLAKGGMAEIHLALQSGIGGFEKHTVIKRILPDLCEDQKFIEMFLDEARIAATLNHPNVIQVFDMGMENGRYYIAMEYLSGESLASVLNKLRKSNRRLPPELGVGIVLQAAEGLHFAHEALGVDGKPLGIIHRDISPQNIFVLYDGGAKVVDFGIAHAENRLTQTQTGMIKGKLAYMAPEQIRGEPEQRSDIFSLGIVLWECLTGQRLFQRDAEFESMQAIIEQQAPPIRSLVSTLPEQLEQITARALARDTAERYQSALDLRNDLQAYLLESRSQGDTMAIGRFMGAEFSQRIAKKRELLASGSQVDEEEARTVMAASTSMRDLDPAPASPAALSPTVEHTEQESSIAARHPLSPPPPSPGPATQSETSAATNDGLPPVSPPARKRGWGARLPKLSMAVWGLLAVIFIGGTTLMVLWLTGALDGSGRLTDIRIEPVEIPVEAFSDGARQPPHGIGTPPSEPDDSVEARDDAPKPGHNPARTTAGTRNATGKLRLQSKPWTKIYHKGKLLGPTPLVDVKLPVGKVTLQARNPDLGVDETISVRIRAGRTTRKVFTFKTKAAKPQAGQRDEPTKPE